MMPIGSAQTDGGSGHAQRAAGNLQAFEMKDIARTIELVGDQRFEVGIGDDLFAVSQFLETREGFVEFVFIERMSHFGQPRAQGGAARMFAHHQRWFD